MKQKYLYILIIILLLVLFVDLIYKLNNIKEHYNNHNNKILIHKILLKPKTASDFPPGFGDTLKGTFMLYMISKKYGYTFYLDLTNHPIGDYIVKTIPDKYTNLNDDVNEYFNFFNSNNLKLINEVTAIMETKEIGIFETNTNLESDIELTNDDRIILQNILKPTNYLNDKINLLKQQYELNEYSVIHIRAGDDNMNTEIDSKIIGNIENIITKINIQKKILVVSDSNYIKKYLYKKYKFKMIESEIIHLGYLNSSNNIEKSIESTLIDFFLICGANKIYSLSVYDWNSGFSTMASRLFDIPIEKYII